MASIIFTSQPSSLTAVPGQDSTFNVIASANFSPVSFTYQWNLSAVTGMLLPITGATSSSYMFDPLMSDNGKVFVVSVSALSSSNVMATANSNGATISVFEDSHPFDVFDLGNETGRERHRRLRHLGYV